MLPVGRSRRALAVVGVAWVLAAAPAASPAAISDDSPSAVTLPAGSLSSEAPGIRKLLESYVRAVETKDVQMFRTVKPNLADEEERRVRAAFKSVQTQVVKMNVLSLDVRERRATVKVARRDTINGTLVSSFPQTFLLAKEAAGWTIQDIGR
jgi:hypothetical protein